MEIQAISNPRYNNKGSIELNLHTTEYGIIPFTASQHDVEELGRTLYQRAINREFGSIQAYVPDLTILATDKINKVKEERDKALSSGMYIDGVLFDTDDKAILAYMKFILATLLNPNIVISDWKASDNTWVRMDQTLITKILMKWLQVEPAAFSWQKNKLAEIQNAYNSSDVSALSNISTSYES